MKMTAKKYLEMLMKNFELKALVQSKHRNMTVFFELGNEIECYENDAEELWTVMGTEVEAVTLPSGHTFRRAKFNKELLSEYLNEFKASHLPVMVVVGL